MNFWMGQPVFPGCCWPAQCVPIFLRSLLEEHLPHYLDILAFRLKRSRRTNIIQIISEAYFLRNVCPTFGQSAGTKVVNVHDVSFQFQGDTLHRGLQLHAAVTDQHIHTAVTLHHLSHHVLHALHVTEIQDHQLWSKRLGRHNKLLLHRISISLNSFPVIFLLSTFQ